MKLRGPPVIMWISTGALMPCAGFTGAGTTAAAVRQAYVTLLTPVGNGIDWKVGAMDDSSAMKATPMLQSELYPFLRLCRESTTLVGMLGSYKSLDAVTVQAGVANAYTASATSLAILCL